MADFGDLAQRISELDLERVLQRRAAERLPPTEHLRCEACDREIPAARREAVPGVRLCITCQTALEGTGR